MAERDFGHGWGWDASVGFYEGLSGSVLIRITAGILAPSMEYWQSAPECRAAFGIVGRDSHARSHASDKELASSNARVADGVVV